MSKRLDSIRKTTAVLERVLNDPQHQSMITDGTYRDLKATGIAGPLDRDGYCRVGGKKTKVLFPGDPQIAKIDMIVCRLWDDGPQEYPDNVKGICHVCFREVRHRPHAPQTAKKICVDCMGKRTAN